MQQIKKILKTILLTILLLLIVTIVKSDNVNELLNKLSEKINNEQVVLNIDISEKYRNTDLEKSKYYINKALYIAEKLNNTELLAKANKSAGVTFYFSGDYDKAIFYYNNAVDLFKKLKDFENLSRTYNNIGIIYEHWGDYKNSMNYYLKCLNIEQNLNDTIGMAGSYNNLANTCFYIKEYDEGIKYLHNALEIYKNTDKTQQANILNNIGVFYEKANNLDSAYNYYLNSLKIRKQINDKVGVAQSYNNIGYIHFLKTEYTEAVRFLLKSLKISYSTENKKQIFSTTENLCRTYLKLNKLDSTEYYITKSMGLNDSTNFYNYKLEYLFLKSEIYKKKKDFLSALNFYKKYTNLKDSLLNKKNIENVELIHQKYKNKQNQKELELKNLQIQKTKSENKYKNQINKLLTYSIIILSLFLLVLFYLLFLNKKINKKLKTEANVRKQIQDSLSFTKQKLKEALKNKDSKIINQLNYTNSVLMSLPIGVITSDLQGNITFANKYTKIIFGITDTSKIQSINLFNDDRFINFGIPEYLNNTIETKKIQQFTITANNSESKKVTTYKVTIKYIDNLEEPFLLGLIEDVTLQKLYEENLVKLKNSAADSNKLKSVFLANLSHEIRTPLNAIIGFSELLENNNLPEEKSKRYLKIIQNNSLSLLNLINDIIDISKIEAGKLKINKSVTDVNNLLMQQYFISKEINLKNKENVKINVVLPEKEMLLITDEVRLKQIIANLLNNAIKFTNNGEITFGYKKLNDKIRFFIKDTGVGIPEEDLDTIFDRFFQASNQVEKVNSGSGLGLTITKNLVELLGGNIYCKSKVNVGSEFYFYLPNDFVIVEDETINQDIDIDLTDKKILIAEDNDANYLYINELLKNKNAQVTRVLNGFELLNLIKENNNFDLILMDIRMPVVDGIKAMHELKKLNLKIPVIAQTAYASDDEKEKYKKEGFDDYISKPINKRKLFELLKKYINLA